MSENTNIIQDSDGDWEVQLLAKAADAEVERKGNGDEEQGDVTRCMPMKETLVQASYVTDAYSHVDQPQLIESSSVTNYRLLMAGQTTPEIHKIVCALMFCPGEMFCFYQLK